MARIWSRGIRSVGVLSIMLATGVTAKEPAGVVTAVEPRRAPPAVDLQLIPQPAATQAQLTTVQKSLAAAVADLADARDQIKTLQMQMAIYQKLAEILTDRVNSSDTRFAKHTHQYSYNGVDFTTKWFVTSGRPIAQDEKKDYASVISALPVYIGQTAVPTPVK